jgi:hypothetical protein
MIMYVVVLEIPQYPSGMHVVGPFPSHDRGMAWADKHAIDRVAQLTGRSRQDFAVSVERVVKP